ncbi:MAG: hypothetical protein ABSC94_31435 [Polyangiaceae bacterium]|jgi:tRNA nucleotidyltransferase (CCA-adding enzyme)
MSLSERRRVLFTSEAKESLRAATHDKDVFVAFADHYSTCRVSSVGSTIVLDVFVTFADHYSTGLG